MSNPCRVAITGVGALTPLGIGAQTFYEALLSGRSGIGPITQIDVSEMPCKIAGEVPGYDPDDHFDKKTARNIERFSQFAVVAAREAITQSGIMESGLAPERIGVISGNGIGAIGHIEESVKTMFERGHSRVSPFLIPKIITNAGAGNIAINLGLKGPNSCTVTACAAGTNAIGEAAETIRRGAATAMIAGGSESSMSYISIAGFAKMRALCLDSNDSPETASRPFDATRSGFVMGEGAGMLLLEDWEHAKARGAKILGELAGYGNAADAYHMTAPAPDGEGGARAMQAALDQSGLKPEEVGYVNAHGTSTTLNDKLETAAIKTVFGDHASNMAISSNKSMIGHLLGGAGGVEAVATVLTLINQELPPTINLNNPDPECDLDYVPNKSRKVKGLNAALSNSLGFGGHNSVILITRASD